MGHTLLAKGSGVTPRDAVLQLLAAEADGRPEVTEAVKSASFQELFGLGLPASAFADPADRSYPYHTATATLASLGRLAGEPDGTRKQATLAALTKRAREFGVDPSPAVARPAPATEKAAAFADPSLPASPDEARAAVAQAVSYNDHFPLSDLRKLATHVLTAFPDAAGDHRPTLEKWAGLGQYDRSAVVEALTKRAHLHRAAGRLDEAEVTAELALVVLETPLGAVKMAELAETVDAVDRAAGLYGFDGVLPAREFCRFPLAAVERVVEDLVESGTGVAFSKSALATVDSVRLQEVFGTDYHRSLCDGGLFLSEVKVASAVERADATETRLWATLVPPVA